MSGTKDQTNTFTLKLTTFHKTTNDFRKILLSDIGNPGGEKMLYSIMFGELNILLNTNI